MFDWNDLRHFLAVARHGSTLAAAKVMRVSQSTVHRRVAALEKRIGRPLVKRYPTGYQLTELGQELKTHAERVEQAVLDIERHLAAAERDPVGTVRVTCAEPLVYRLTRSPLLDRFHARYPGLRVEFVMSDRYLDLTKGEADIAIRAGDTTDGPLVARKLSHSPWAVYASRAYLARHGKPARAADINHHAVIGFDGPLSDHRAARWLRKIAPDARIAARNSSVLGLVYAAKSGVGLATLPVALGGAEPDLVRVLGPIAELATSWHLLTHPDLRRTPRVRAFFDFMVEELVLLRPILLGEAGSRRRLTRN